MIYKLECSTSIETGVYVIDETRNYDKPLGVFENVKIKELLTDENGVFVGIKGLADQGRGYGFDYGWKEFTLKPGEEYRFSHSFTSIDGPSDWSKDDYPVTVRLRGQ